MLHMHCGDGSSLTSAKKNKLKLKRKLWPPPPRDDFQKRAYAWLREAYVSAEVIVCVCTVSAT